MFRSRAVAVGTHLSPERVRSRRQERMLAA
jgi:hypothetical protein